MKRIIKTASYIALAIVAISCAKAVKEGTNDANVRYFESWLKVNGYDRIQPSGLGIYIIEDSVIDEEIEGKGTVVKKGSFVYADYTITDLEGNISNYTDAETAKQLGTYSETAYYGPKVISTAENTIQAGLSEAIVGMKVGDHRKVIIPGWLMSYKTYGSAQEYIENSSSGSNAIYDITIKACTDSIPEYEDGQIKKYIDANAGIFNSVSHPTQKDTAFYYQVIERAEEDAKPFGKDTTIYINYTGKLLNGMVFDTTDERTAKDNGIYSASRSYAPVKVSWGEKYTDITMGSGSSVIPGFALTLWQMRPMETAIGVFNSALGYSYSGSGNSIPAYAPLIFEIQIVEKPEE